MSKGRYGDPTIPQKEAVAKGGNAAERSRVIGPVEGRFIDYGDRVVLADSKANSWSVDQVRIVTGGFGSSRSGIERAPRPFKYGPSNEVLITGDFVLIVFPEGNPQRPVVLGGIRSLAPEDSAFFAAQPLGGNPNRMVMRQVQLDPAGNQSACFDLEIFTDNTKQEAEIRVFRPNGPSVRVKVDAKTGTITIGAGKEEERPILGDEYLTDYAGIVDDVIAIGIAAGAPATNAAAVKVKLTVDPDAYRSKVIKVQ
tara:strand:- start:9903 stop:10664 length:762 start_codon:yes stop_codon:yes gene_type:complete